MSDIVERLRTRPTGDPYLHMMVHEAADEIERLRAEVAGLREDAERYRWLRDPHNQDCHSVGKCAPGIERYEAIDWLYDDELDVSIDAAIDAARKGEA